MYRRILLLPLLLLLPGCAGNVLVPYPEPSGEAETGTILVKFTEPMRSVSVEVDDMLLVRDEHTEQVEIEGVPSGRREITVAASESSRTRSVRYSELVVVEAGKVATILLDTPPQSTGYWIQSAAALLLPWLLIVDW